MKYIWYMELKDPFKKMAIAEDGRGITDVCFCLDQEKKLENTIRQKTPLLEQAMEQLKEYFAGERKEFDLPLSLHGTKFQIEDWKALQTIPYGETRSYQQIAEQLGNPKASRAVGMANHRNPIAVIIPCHRVIGKNGSLTGYAEGVEIKQALLELEHQHIQSHSSSK